MLERLGKVLYWLALLIAIPSALLGVVVVYFGHVDNKVDGLVLGIFLICVGVVAWLVGLAVRYILTERKDTNVAEHKGNEA